MKTTSSTNWSRSKARPEWPSVEVLVLKASTLQGILKTLQRATEEGWQRVSPIQGRPGSANFEIVMKRGLENES